MTTPIPFYITTITTLLLGQHFPELNFFSISFYLSFIIIIIYLIKLKKSGIVIALILGLVLSGLRLGLLYKQKDSSHISNYLNLENNIQIKGNICEEIDKRSHKTKLTICTNRICQTQNKVNICKKTHGKILANINRFPQFKYLDNVKVFGKLSVAPEDEDFSYKNYLSRYEIYGLISWATIELDNSKSFGIQVVGHFYSSIFQFKDIFLKRISIIYPEPHGSFLAGLLVGARKGLPKDISEDFQKNGLAHLVAISGYNITLLMVIITQIFGFLGKKTSFYLSTLSIFLFTIFVGASSAVVRAAIMGILSLIALRLGRPSLILTSTLLTASLISLYNPKILWWDLGFQLSFLALIGVIWLVPIFPKFIKNIPDFLGFKEAVILTIAASITTIPIMSYNFGKISLISPIANLFVAPLTPLAMLFGFFSIISPFDFLEKSFGFITYCFLDLALKFSHFFASFKYASIEFETNEIQTILLLILIFGLMIWRNLKN